MYKENPVLAGGSVRELHTGAGKITSTAFFFASTSIFSDVGAHVGAVRTSGRCLGTGVCGLRSCLEPKLRWITSQCCGIGLISYQTYRSGTGMMLC